MDAKLVGTMLRMNTCGLHVEMSNYADNDARVIPPAYELEYLGVYYNGSGLVMSFQVRRLLKSQIRQGIIQVEFVDEYGVGDFNFFGAAWLYDVNDRKIIELCCKMVKDVIEGLGEG